MKQKILLTMTFNNKLLHIIQKDKIGFTLNIVSYMFIEKHLYRVQLDYTLLSQ